MGLIADGAILQNEVKAWPPLIQIGSGLDMVTGNHWWDTVGTPTTEATAVPVSGEAGLEAKFLDVIKCVTDAANEGFKQRYTYSEEPRIKSGAVISALVWVGHASGVASCDVTVKLLNSDASETVGAVIASTTDWECHLVEGHSCAGTYVDLQVTKDTAGTFYAGGPITVMLGASAIGLNPRRELFRARDGSAVKTLTGIGDEAAWTDVDCTSATSALATRALMSVNLLTTSTSDGYDLFIRRNGSSAAANAQQCVASVPSIAGTIRNHNQIVQLLDDAQIFEYYLDRWAGSTTLDEGTINLVGYWEWE